MTGKTRDSRTGLRLAMALTACGCLVMRPDRTLADEVDRISVIEENDVAFHTDKHYTQGLRLSDLAPKIDAQSSWNGPFDALAAIAPIFPDDGKTLSRRYATYFGQSLFTPQNQALKPPDPRDRPYAAWLYVGTSLLQETDRRMLENVELDIGIIGPGALGRQTQNDFHQFIGDAKAQGWSHEVQSEPGGTLTYERLWRFALLGGPDNGIDIVPQMGVTAGNVLTYGNTGALLRIGRNLRADYGPARIRPGLSGTNYFDGEHLDGDFGYYVFAGTEGRIVGRNIFLDGNTVRISPNVSKNVFVADVEAGVSIFWSNSWRIDVSALRRTREFKGQTTPDVIGLAALTFSL